MKDFLETLCDGDSSALGIDEYAGVDRKTADGLRRKILSKILSGPDGIAVLPSEVGHVDVVVTKDGFFPARKALDIDAAQGVQLQFELDAANHEEEVTVHATRNDIRVQDSPLHVEVVSQDEITEEIAMRPSDISMLLNEMGGMRVQTSSPGLGAAAVRVQGMRGRYTAFLSDGRLH